MNGAKLLDSYRSTGSETAFAELLQRYTNMVYSVAKRRVSDQSLAEEVTQTVSLPARLQATTPWRFDPAPFARTGGPRPG